jgi:hypothetical protein
MQFGPKFPTVRPIFAKGFCTDTINGCSTASGELAQSGPAPGKHNGPWAELQYDFLAGTELDFDPQAFFNDYMFTG